MSFVGFFLRDFGDTCKFIGGSNIKAEKLNTLLYCLLKKACVVVHLIKNKKKATVCSLCVHRLHK